MNNKIVYCLDCETEFRDALKGYGFGIHSASLGYTKGVCYINEPPNESDIIVFNLVKPGYFDMNDWGPNGGNDNFRCTLVDKVNKSMYVSGGRFGSGTKHPRFKLIQESQIQVAGNSTFNYGHIQKAIFDGGIDCIFYLNPCFMFHCLYDTPRWVGLTFETDVTKSNRWNINEDAIKIYNQISEIGKDVLEFSSPIEFKLLSLRLNSSGHASKTSKIDLLTTNVNESLGAIVKFGKGFIYFLPPFNKPVEATVKLINDIIPSFKHSYTEMLIRQAKPVFEGKAIEKKVASEPSELLPIALFNNTRDYLNKVVIQINGCYVNKHYDACAAMMRRLIETLIIEIYENTGRLDDIKDKGEIITLERLLDKLSSDSEIHVSRNVKKTLEKIKTIGDTGSHNRKVNLLPHNISDLKTEFNIAVQELLQNINFHPSK